MRDLSADEILSSYWGRKIALDLVNELEALTGERRSSIEEVRHFLAAKSHRELLKRLQSAREGKSSHLALRSVATTMREYALERPVLAAAALRIPTEDTSEWKESHSRTREFLLTIFAECGVYGLAAEQALIILQSLVRGFVIHELVEALPYAYPYNENFARALDVYVAGLPALIVEEKNG
jgi:hypothetical protein